MHNRIIELINQHMNLYHDPLLISNMDYNKLNYKKLAKMKMKNWIKEEQYNSSFQFNFDDMKKFQFDVEAMIANQLILEIIKTIYTDIFLKIKNNNKIINSIGFNDIMRFNRSYFINPNYLSKIIMTIERYNLHMHDDEIEGWDTQFEKLFDGRRYLTNPFWISNIVNKKYIYAFDDICTNNIYHIKKITYNVIEEKHGNVKIDFTLNIEFFPMLKQIKIYSL